MRHRDFALFFSAALVSNTGTWMQTITVPYVLDQLTHSTVWVGLGAFCTFFPATVVGPLAGSLADRYSRRTVLLVLPGRDDGERAGALGRLGGRHVVAGADRRAA